MGLDISVNRITKDVREHYFTYKSHKSDNSDCYPNWSKEFLSKKEELFYDWNKYKEETGIDIDKLEWCGTKYGKSGCFMFVKNPETEEKIEIDLEKVPIYPHVDDVLYYDEVGYQRKGLNSKFYEDYKSGKIGYFVWTLAELQRYKEDYCDDDTKENFQRNIIDNFIEGKDCVTFDW